MRAQVLFGPDAGSRKYDIITALGCYALSASKSEQKLILRFITLITARYNWRIAQLSIGQREIARMWSVNERTVKREMAKLRDIGWLVQTAPARRGSVARYSVDLDAIERVTSAAWPRVGPDFEERMTGRGRELAGPIQTNVVNFPQSVESDEISLPDSVNEWARACALLRKEEPMIFENWFNTLHRVDRESGVLILRAPNAYHAKHVRTKYTNILLATLCRIDAALCEVKLIS